MASLLQWSPVKFYGKRQAQLLDEISGRQLIQKLKEKYKLNTQLDFKSPGYKYYKFLKEDELTMIESYRHLVTPHYGLNPVWLLWCCQLSDQKNYTLYINLVTGQIINSHHRWADDVYRQEMILEGEIFKGRFIIWDLLVLNQELVYKNQTLYQRLDRLRAILNYQYRTDSLIENIRLTLRPHVEYPYIKTLLDLPDASEYQGIIFAPLKNSSRCFTLMFRRPSLKIPLITSSQEKERLNPQPIADRLIVGDQLKDIGNPITRVFWLQPTNEPDNYWLYSWSNQTIYRQGRGLITSNNQSKKIRFTFKEHQAEKGRNHQGIYPLLPFTCRWVARFRKWEPIELVETMNIGSET